MASPSSPSPSPLLLLPPELVLLIGERCADSTDDPQALLRLSWAGSVIRREVILADDLWERAFRGAAAATTPQPPPGARSSAPQWRKHYLDLLRSLCRECGCRPTPYVHALLPGKPRLCPGCEQALPRCRLITALEAREVWGVGEQQLSGLPSVVTCGVRMWLASAVEGLAGGGGASSSGEEEEDEDDSEEEDERPLPRPRPRGGGEEGDAERRRQERKAAKRAAKEAQRLRRAQEPGGRGGHEQRQQEQQQQQQRRRQQGRRRSGGASDADKGGGGPGGARRATEKQRSGYVEERESLAAEYGQHAFSALVLKSLMED